MIKGLRDKGYEGYKGLIKQRYKGLDIDRSTAFPRPVQIIRRKSHYVRHSQTSIAPYHTYKGLSSLPQNGGGSRRIPNIPIDITNPIYLIERFG
jgi:hypothetical protein